VGAFDPLDEQEAQRVGADGVLKKPFVPPDPLISMVKSALTRAGVSLGPAATPDKPAAPARTSADILGGNVGSKIAALSPERVPEVAPEPLEEFATPREQVKIAAGEEPVAFGNLLKTNEEEESAVCSSKPMIEIAKSKEWDEETQDVPEEEQEEEEARGGWRAGGLDEALEQASKSTASLPDWRDEAFHGDSPAKSNGSQHWAPTEEKTEFVEAAETKSVAVTTLDHKPADAPLPFSGDAWAAAMAAGVEEKLAQQRAENVVAPSEPSPVVDVPADRAADLPGTVAASLRESQATSQTVPESTAATEPANWAPVPESSWDAEAKRASMLASTWDAPAPAPVPAAAEETQEVSVYTSEQAEVHAERHVEGSATSNYSSHFESAPPPVESAELPAIDTSAEVSVEAANAGNWETAWEGPKSPALNEVPAQADHEAARVGQEQAHASLEPAAAPAEAVSSTAPEPAQPNMDELVARVLGKMNPDVLQKVTREILKPVIEAIVRDELNSKKS